MKSLSYLITILFLICSINAFSQEVARHSYSMEVSERHPQLDNKQVKKSNYSLTLENNSLKIKNGKGKLVIRTMIGQIVKEQSILSNNLTTISIQELKDGKYIVHIIQPNGSVQTQQFTK